MEIKIKIFLNLIKTHQNINNDLIKSDSIKIKQYSHFFSYINGNQVSKEKYNLGSILTHSSKIKFKDKSKLLELKSSKYAWPDNIEYKINKIKIIDPETKIETIKTSYQNLSLVDNVSIDKNTNYTINYFKKIADQKIILNNIIAASLEKNDYIGIFTEKKLILKNFDESDIVIDRLGDPKIFGLLNSNSKFVVDNIQKLRSSYYLEKELDLNLLKSATYSLINLNSNKYNILLNLKNDADLEGFIRELLDENQL